MGFQSLPYAYQTLIEFFVILHSLYAALYDRLLHVLCTWRVNTNFVYKEKHYGRIKIPPYKFGSRENKNCKGLNVKGQKLK
ncbi:hypothetical protein H8356DRAFT_1325742 [Neocallimastix lanati (nom. inval.)]|nr:hypothetical protein H8356DRAFT_1325742 [Neocallimastix sp. JGI-2020a]